MGTSNFYNKNASKIYACEIAGDYHYEDLIQNIQFELKNKGFDLLDEFDNERNFSGKYIAEKRIDFGNVNQSIQLKIKAVVRSGYYSGVNLDYDFKIIGNCWVNNWSDFEIDEKKDLDFEVGKGFKTLFKKAKKALEKEVAKLEKIFAKNSVALSVGTRFSNGETIYLRENQTMESYIEAIY